MSALTLIIADTSLFFYSNQYSFRMRLIYFLLCFLALSPCASGQTKKSSGSLTETLKEIDSKTVVGQVFDEDGEPLAGVTVMLKGTDHGVATDMDGQFSILISGKNPELIFSYIGMKTTTFPIQEGGKFLRIVMTRSDNMMDEVVVTGYQNIKRENATGSYQILSSEDLDRRSVTNLSDKLEGSMPGLVKNTKSDSKDEDAFTVRGVGTFQAATKPLVVVDGLPIEGGMSTINPYDIENITLLKDAAAASIYGARAANGVLVITTKRAKAERLTIDFNADLTIHEKQKYDNYDWMSAAQLIQLERYNWAAMLAEEKGTQLSSLLTSYSMGRMSGISPASRLFAQNQLGLLSDDEMNATLDSWASNDYRKEYQDVHDRSQIEQTYNLSLRTQGRIVNSSLVANYTHDNLGIQKENANSLTFKYRGEIKASKWLDVTVGLNVLNRRSRTHSLGYYGDINSFLPYQTMYNADGSYAGLEADIYPGHEAFSNPDLELKDCTFNLAQEMNRNFSNTRYTNTRTYINTLFKLLPGWTATVQFQYEDIYQRNRTLNEGDSYTARMLYSGYTTGGTVSVWEDSDRDPMDAFFDPFFDWSKYQFGTDADGNMILQELVTRHLPTEHHIPEGGILTTTTRESKYYTFRAQTNYNRTFFERHQIDALAGFEYRQTRTNSHSDLMYGYDDATQTNLNIMTDWAYINKPTTGVFGDHYVQGMAPKTFATSDLLHRYYSVYFNANYIYDSRYAVSGSYRVDKCDLFGTDPKFRGRPLWSVGGSWNAHNEQFLRDVTWLNAFKPRFSYGLTGNIDSSVSSYLVAKMSVNSFTGDKTGSLVSPPNDQLRWEKTATFNAGFDFALFGYRLNGSVDFYNKRSSDVLTVTDLDATTGWSSLTINSGKVRNRGLEIQLDGRIVRPNSRNDFGFDLGFNLAFNKNKVLKLSHYPQSGAEQLSFTLHEGYPLNSIFSFDFAGFVEDNGQYYMGWRDKDGEVHTTSIGNSDFKIEDAVYCGSATPTVTASLTPQLTWRGFTLSAMMAFYGGHYMRAGEEEWYVGGSSGGYYTTWGMGGDVPVSALKYWEGDTSRPANGAFYYSTYNYMSYAKYRNTNVHHADYLKVRNIVLSYNFDKKICRKIGMDDLRLRFQINNLATWARNGLSLDPEAVSAGYNINKAPRSYTMSLYFSL